MSGPAYELTDDNAPAYNQAVIRLADNTTLEPNPADPGWQAYISWLSAGNAPVPAGWVAPVVVPSAVTPAQARVALYLTPSPVNSGKTLLDDVNAAVAAAGGETAIWWASAVTIELNSPTVAAIGAGLNLTQAQINALFTLAAQQEA